MENNDLDGAPSDEDDDPQAPTRSASSPTSRIAVQKIYSVISGLTEYKKIMVEEIWFDGVLKFPDITKLNFIYIN